MSTAIPGPDGLPLVGNTLGLVRGQGEYIERVAAEYGGVASVSMVGAGEIVLVSAPDLVEAVFFDDRYVKASLARDALAELLGEGLLLAEGEAWRRQRELVQPAFGGDQLAIYADVMTDRAREFTGSLVAGRTYDVGDEMRRLTFRILLDAVFGQGLDYERWDLRSAVDSLMAPGKPRNQPLAYAVPKWVPIPMWRRYHDGVERFEAVIDEMVRRRRSGDGDRDDLLSVLLAASDGDGGLTDAQLRDELMTMLFAGHETTATALTFAWHLLGTHPAVDRRLHRELDRVLGDRPPALADLPDLEYTGHVVREAMRLYPPVPATAREPTEAVALGGYDVPAGTTVAPSEWLVHRDGELYDEPTAFRPERWAERPEDARHRFAYFPFGGGPRRCVGEAFAMQEAQLILATVARSYRLAVPDERPLDPSVSIVTQPNRPVEAVARRRGGG